MPTSCHIYNTPPTILPPPAFILTNGTSVCITFQFSIAVKGYAKHNSTFDTYETPPPPTSETIPEDSVKVVALSAKQIATERYGGRRFRWKPIQEVSAAIEREKNTVVGAGGWQQAAYE